MNGAPAPFTVSEYSWYNINMKSDTGSHYSLAFSPRMPLFVKGAIELLLKHCKNENVLLHFRGFSGAAHGLALYHGLLALPEHVIGQTRVEAFYSRKDEEIDNHGHKHEMSYSGRFIPSSVIFVDDFISSGDTMRQSIAQVKRHFKRRKVSHRHAGWFTIVGSDLNCDNSEDVEVEFNTVKYCGSYRMFEAVPFDSVILSP